MSKVLLRETKRFVVDTENEVEVLLEEFKNGKDLVVGTDIKRKIKKDDEYFVVTVIQEMCSEKDSRGNQLA